MKRGWWKLTFTGVDELTEMDREAIIDWIKKGCTEGEIIQEEEESPTVSAETHSDDRVFEINYASNT